MLEVYTDGSSFNNNTDLPTIGGWAAVYVKDGKVIKCRTKKCKKGTSLRMELEAIATVLEDTKDRDITIYTDYYTVVEAFEKGYIEEWKKRRWKRLSRGKLQYSSCWKRIYDATRNRNVTFKYGAKMKYHRKADQLSRIAAKAT